MVRLICLKGKDEEGAVFDVVDMSDAELEDAYGAKVVRKYEVVRHECAMRQETSALYHRQFKICVDILLATRWQHIQDLYAASMKSPKGRERDSLPYGAWTNLVFSTAPLGRSFHS